MSTSSPLKSAAWAVAGAALLGGGMFLGFVSALAGRRLGEPAGPEPEPKKDPAPGPDLISVRRIDELARAVGELQKRVDGAAPPPAQAAAERLDEVSFRVAQLESRVEQLVSETPAVPPVDQMLAAVEHMVAAKIAGLDERLTHQVHAIELLRNASAQTDVLLQKLIRAVETLAEQTGEKIEAQLVPHKDYPIA